MKVIFLDIDGVLNTEVYVVSVFEACERAKIVDWTEVVRDEYGQLFDPTATRFLKYIIDVTDAKLVISSTWRHSGIEVLKEMWQFRDLPGDIIDITPCHMHNTGSTLQRGKEIQEWLDAHPEVSSYAIIDDDTDMEESQLNNFINTDPTYGITYNDAEKAIAILNT